MACSETIFGTARCFNQTPCSSEERLWYAAYTRSRHEKRVAQELGHRGIEAYLPLYDAARQWRNGRHIVQIPLFPGYTFARLALRDRVDVLRTHGVVDLVGFGGAPIPLEEEEIANLKKALSNGRNVEPHPFIAEGRRVRITAGPLAGLHGIVVRRNGQMQVVLSVELIRRSVLVKVDSAELEISI